MIPTTPTNPPTPAPTPRTDASLDKMPATVKRTIDDASNTEWQLQRVTAERDALRAEAEALRKFTREDKFLPKPIRTATIMTFWTYNRPKQGQRINVPMKSGLTAIYEVTRIEQATGVDWQWVDLSFVAYHDEPSGKPYTSHEQP